MIADTITVTVTRWDGGWEIEIDEDNITQARSLDHAQRQVRDYLDTLHPELDHSGWEVIVLPADRMLADRLRASREATRAAQRQQQIAAKEARELALYLRQTEHLGVGDTAALLGVSRGRISQLTKAS